MPPADRSTNTPAARKPSPPKPWRRSPPGSWSAPAENGQEACPQSCLPQSRPGSEKESPMQGRTQRAANILGIVVGLGLLAAPWTCATAGKTMPPYAVADRWIETQAETLRAVNHRIWAHPEVGLQERRSSAELIA